VLKKELRNFNCKDCVIIWGGSNDINKNESLKGLKYIASFAAQNQHTIIIIMPTVHRHDLLKSACINTERQTFNRKLRKMIKPLLHVKLLDITLDRDDFIRHGMHLNRSGGDKVAKIIGQHTIDLLTRQEDNILTLPWIEANKDPDIRKETCHTVGDLS
jgi:hypothetical protein